MDYNKYAEELYKQILKEKYWVFTAGTYPQGVFTAADLKQIADNYDKDFCEAPIWIGHPSPDEEPEALAWIDRVIAEGDMLYVKFSYVSEQLIYMLQNKRFKRVSVELWKFAEKPGWYLYAIGLTNRPQIKNLAPIEFEHAGVNSAKFSMDRVLEKKSFNLQSRITFSDEIKNNLSQKLNKSDMKIEDIKKFATERNITIPEGASDQEVVGAVFSYVDAATKELTEVKAEVAKFGDTTKTLEEQIAELKGKEVDLIVEFGMTAKRISTEEQKAYYKKFGMEFGPEKLKEAINTLPVSTLFSENQVQNNAAAQATAKFKNSDGSPFTYSDYLNKVKENPKFSDNYTDEEVNKLREETW
ncbi:MAG TPA: phage protease [Ignavibacteria bacterium]|nr:hypothetical protein [Bacteroidota bacterium]HRE10761.1 phage protease [Ignavibacteria bacterium]HRF65997.1 phage protease [Ignavibacteria bacterium]HRJ02838.1 phage protease [Ignavibacteria bacterium]HRJ84396.1 phage protease [Ignavibacteria bacterium]